MKAIAFYNNKGGVGKTTSVINIAYTLAAANKVLVIDLDGQANCSRFFAAPKDGLAVALVERNSTPEAAYSSTRYPNIDVITATGALNLIAASFERLSGDEQTANIRKILEFGGGYDYVLLDLPPALSRVTSKVISLCDSVYIPIELGIFAIQGIPVVTGNLTNCNAKFGGCIVNKFDKENPSDNELLELLKSMLGNKVLRTAIPFSRVIKNSFSFRLTANEYMPWTAAAEAYEKLALEIIERTVNGI